MGIIDEPVLVLDEVPNMFGRDAGATDGFGRRLATYELDGGLGSRMATGVRSVLVREGSGAPFMRVSRPLAMGRERVQLQDPGGAPFLALERGRWRDGGGVVGALTDGRAVTCGGLSAPVVVAGRTAALLSPTREQRPGDPWPRTRTRVVMDPGADPAARAAAIGCVLALELIRIRSERGSSD